MVQINGEMKDLAGKSVHEALDIMDFAEKRVVVELNGEIVPRDAYGETVLGDGDTVEVVSFVGGG